MKNKYLPFVLILIFSLILAFGPNTNIFDSIGLASLLLLPVVLIKPSLAFPFLKDINRKKGVPVLILLFFLGVMLSPQSKTKNYTTEKQSSPTKKVEAKPSPTGEAKGAQAKTPTPSPKKTSTPTPNPTAKPISTPAPTSTPTITLTPKPTKKPTLTPEPDPYEVMYKIGKEVAGDNSNVSVFKNKDRSIDVINNIQLTPEVEWDWAMDISAKKWATKFISKSYHSGLNLRYVLVTVSFLYTGRPATRVGLGVKQAKKLTEEDWKAIEPSGLCYILERIQIGDNVYPDEPYYDPSNWAFAKNCN